MSYVRFTGPASTVELGVYIAKKSSRSIGCLVQNQVRVFIQFYHWIILIVLSKNRVLGERVDVYNHVALTIISYNNLNSCSVIFMGYSSES